MSKPNENIDDLQGAVDNEISEEIKSSLIFVLHTNELRDFEDLLRLKPEWLNNGDNARLSDMR